jgi:tetratricopeptide (TPR) repeat protein/tRNA A-37 threonylcarbamoyl transferase component Bud32
MSEERLQSLLSVWQQQLQQGRDVSATELCRDCPELAAELAGQIEVLKRMEALMSPDPDQTVTRCRPEESTLPGQGENGSPPTGSIAGYELLRELGRGGMGVVYMARQLKPQRLVALKMILAGGHAGQRERARFLAEAEAVAGLQHPNLVSLLEYGEHEGLPYFTLEFVPGGSLASRLKGVPQPSREAAHLVEQLARAIHYAHTRGIVHRDLKPANVLIAADETPKIADFGLARRVEAGPGLTGSGDVLGTPSYMAPEQASGETKSAGPAADVYALGAILYECLTGRPPFRAANAMETVLQVLNQEPVSVRELQPQVPPDLSTICHKCLQKDPHRRYPDALALAEDCAAFLEGSPIRARPVSSLERAWRWCRRHPAVSLISAAALLFLVGGLAGMTLLYLQAEEQRLQAVAASDYAEEQRLQAVAASGYADQQRRQAEAAREHAEGESNRANRESNLARASAAEADRQKTLADIQRNAARDQASRAKQVSTVLTGMFDASDPLGFNGFTFGLNNRAGQTLKARDLLEQALKLTHQNAGLTDPVKAEVYLAIGNVYRSIGLHREAQPLLEKVLQIRKSGGASPAEVAASIHALGWLEHERGNYYKAEALYREALAHHEQSAEKDERAILNTQFNLTWLLAEMYELERAEELGKEVLRKRIELFGPDHRETVLARFGMASIYLASQQPAQVLPLLLKNRESIEKLGIDRNILNAIDLFQQGVVHAHLFGDRKKGIVMMRECVQLTRDALGPRHLYVVLPLGQLAIFLADDRQDDEALARFSEVLDIARETVGMAHPRLLQVADYTGIIHRRRNQGHLATPLFEELLAGQRERYGPDHVFVANTLVEQAEHEFASGRAQQTRALLKQAEKIYRSSPGRLVSFGKCLNFTGVVLYREGYLALSEPYYREAISVHRKVYKKANYETTIAMLNLARTLLQQKKYTPECDALLSESGEQILQLPGEIRVVCTQLRVTLCCELYLKRDGDHQKAASLLASHARKITTPASCDEIAQLYASCLAALPRDQSLTEVKRQKLQDEYGAAAVALLRRACKGNPRLMPSWTTTDEALPLRTRADFQAFQAEASKTKEKKSSR